MAVQQVSNAVTAGSTTPYQLDPEQTLKAFKALLQHIALEAKKVQEKVSKRSLIANDDSEAEDVEDGAGPVWLNLATKQHIVDKNRLKPSKIAVPHPLNNSDNLTICVIAADPQRTLKNAIADPSFPAHLSTKITKIIGLQKLTARYKSFESRRQLLSEHDIFLADDRIIVRLPKVLGKIFYQGTTKRPIPISIARRHSPEEKAAKKKPAKKEEKEAEVAAPLVVAAEIERALKCVPVSLKPGTNVSVRIGLGSFTSEQLAENLKAVVPKLIEKHVVKGWRNVKSINIKSPTSFAVPIWLSDDLWADDANIAEPILEGQQGEQADVTKKRKRDPASTRGPQAGETKKAKADAAKVGTEERKQRLAAQKAKAFASD